MRLYDPNNPSNNFFSVGKGTFAYLWCATARPLDLTGNTDVDRERTTVYMKGLRMRDVFGFSGGKTWNHRRIVFATKGVQDENTYSVTSNGVTRKWLAQTDTQASGTASVLFEGVLNKDYATLFMGKTDRSRVHILYDKTVAYRSGNDQAHSHHRTTYVPLEKNFTYDEDENGDTTTSSVWSANTRGTLGDVFVWDILNDVGAEDADTMTVRGDATLYWHEK